MKKANKILIIFFLAFCFGAILTGCRESSALIQTLYTDDATKISSEDREIKNTNDSDIKDEDLATREFDESSSDERERLRDKATHGEGDNGTAPDVKHDKGWSEMEAPQDVDDETDEGEETDTSQKNTSSTGENSSDNKNGETGSENGEDVGDDGADRSENNSSHTTASSDGVREFVDKNGEVHKIEGSVDYVAAVGNAALIVEMLTDSPTALVAANSDFVKDSFAGKVFKGLKLSSVDCLWSGSGSSPMSSSNFNKLLNSEVQACFEISGMETFSDSQIKKLKDKKIEYIVLPQMTTSQGICQAVDIIGQVLADDAAKKADDYVSYYEDIVKYLDKKVKRVTDSKLTDYDGGGTLSGSYKNNKGYFSLFVEAWDSTVKYSLSDGSAKVTGGTGMALSSSGYSSSIMSYYMSIAGVLNVSATASGSKIRYVSPFKANSSTLLTTNSSYSVDRSMLISTKYSKTDSDSVSSSSDAGQYFLGDKEFPGVIAATNTIKKGISKDNLWKFYGLNSAGSGQTEGYGIVDNKGQIITSNIHGDYDVYVNPYGVGSWTNGSVESILEPLWIASAFGSSSSITKKTVKSEIKSFYKEFYGYSLSDSEVNSILDGK